MLPAKIEDGPGGGRAPAGAEPAGALADAALARAVGGDASPFERDLFAISVTKLRTWATGCRLRYRLTHGDARGEGRAPFVEELPLVIGKAGHRVLEMLGDGALSGESDPSHRPSFESVAALISMTPEAANPVVLGRLEEILLRDEALDAIDFRKTLAVEEPFSFDIGDGFTARGVFDRVDRDEAWNTIDVVDYKLGRGLTGPLDEDPQALIYTAAAHEVYADAREVRFRQTWLALLPAVKPRVLAWTPEIDGRARSAARGVLEAIHRETEWAPLDEPAAACRTCPHAHRCPLFAEPQAPQTFPLARSVSEVARRADAFKSYAKVYTKLAKAHEAELRAVLDVNGDFVIDGKEVVLKTTPGRRRWKGVGPEDVTDALLSATGHAPTVDMIEATDGSAVEAWVRKHTSGGQKARAIETLDALAPRKPSQRVVIGDEDEEDDDAD